MHGLAREMGRGEEEAAPRPGVEVRRSRAPARIAVFLLVALLFAAALVWFPALSERYGFVRSTPDEEIGGLLGRLTLITEERRFGWLPIDAERWRVENARGEVLMEESGEGLEEWAALGNGIRGRVSFGTVIWHTGDARISVQVRGKRGTFVQDEDGVLVLAPSDIVLRSDPTDPTSDDDAPIEIRRFEGLELFPERVPRKNPYLDD